VAVLAREVTTLLMRTAMTTPATVERPDFYAL
jgi:hypothetical protein